MLPDKFDSLTLKQLSGYNKHIIMHGITYLIDSIVENQEHQLIEYYESKFTIMEGEEQ